MFFTKAKAFYSDISIVIDMAKKEDSEKKEDGGTRVWMPNSVKKRLESLKVHPRQATHEIISMLLNEYQKKRE